MRFTEMRVAGAYIIDIEPFRDERGFNARTFCESEFADHGMDLRMRQTNVMGNAQAGTMRGFHWRPAPLAESKLFRCTRGAIYDVIIDMRPESATYEQWDAVELRAETHRQLFVPERVAQGFVTLVDDTEVTYQVSQLYAPGDECGIRWDDPAFAIPWPVEIRLTSAKDDQWPDYRRAS